MKDKPTSLYPSATRSSYDAVFHRMAAASGIGYWMSDPSFSDLFWSEQFFRLLDLDSSEVPNFEKFRSLLHPSSLEIFQSSFIALKEAGEPFSIQLQALSGSGTLRCLNLEAWAARDSFGQVIQLAGILKELTSILEEKIKLLFNHSHETIWFIDRNLCLIKGNENFHKTFEWEKGKSIQAGDYLLDEKNMSPEEFTFWKPNFEKAFEGQESSWVVKRYFNNKNGFFQIRIVPIKESDQVIALACYSDDVTTRIEDELKTKELVEKLNLSQKIAKIGYWEFDTITEEIFWTDEVYRIWGLEKESAKPNFQLFIQSFHPDDIGDFLPKHYAALRGEAVLDAVHRVITPDGTIKYVHEKGWLDKNTSAGKDIFKGTVQDISYEKEIEKRLRDRNFFIESTLMNLPMGIAVNNLSTGKANFVNPAFSKAYGWPVGELNDMETFFQKIYPDPVYRKEIRERVLNDIQSKDPERMIWNDIPITTLHGERRYVSAKNIILEELDLMISTVQDVTDRYQAEQSLKISNERFLLATQAVSDAIWDWDVNTKTVLWGPGFKRLFGYPENLTEVSTNFWDSKVHPDDLLRINSLLEATKSDPVQSNWSGEYRFQKADGTYAYVKETAVIIRDTSGKPIRMVGALQDVTEEKENQLLISQKTKFIEATAQIIELFLETDDWESQVPNMLKMMGETVETDRSYLIQMYEKGGEKFGDLTHEWANEQTPSFIDEPEYRAIPAAAHPEIYEKAKQRKPFVVHTREALEATKKILEAQGIKSILNIPIILDNELFGYLGFDSCHIEHDWTEDEKHFIQTVATNLSFAIGRKKQLDQIQESLENHNALLESIGDSFYAFDKEYRVTYWNPTVEKLTGVKQEDILGKCIWEFIPEVNEEIIEAYKIALNEKKKVNFETYDHWFKAWLEVTIYPTQQGVSVVIRDISSKKSSEQQIQEFNERFALITKASHDAIWDWNILTGEHYWGEGFNMIFDEDVAGVQMDHDRWKNSIHPDDRDRVSKVLMDILNDPKKNSFESEYRFIKSNGTEIYLVDKGTVVRDLDGKPTRMVGAIQNITRRKAYEQSLKILNTELAKSIRDLEISNKELEQFAFVASHDLQEPLRMITSFLTLIEKRYADTIDERGQQYIRFAVDGAKRMREIILDLLEFSRIGTVTEEKKLVNASDLVNEVLIVHKKTIREKQALVHLSQLPEILCHPNSIIQVFQNLISNALKYHEGSHRPEISIGFTEKKDSWQFSVSDNGIGIEKEYLEKIFVIFQRLHQKEQYSGTGIGLAICKKIVEFHGGKIWAESEVGKGSTFFFTVKKQ
ncbi:MAG: PAS domain-containing protein [Algoriphagus sp.]|nr:PAS domain-containing protein [Algoriphagus sp.]